jgi:hypothetical protein
MAGALTGAAFGSAIDTAINGWPRKSDWRFGLRTLMVAVVALAVFCYGLKSFLEIINLAP